MSTKKSSFELQRNIDDKEHIITQKHQKSSEKASMLENAPIKKAGTLPETQPPSMQRLMAIGSNPSIFASLDNIVHPQAIEKQMHSNFRDQETLIDLNTLDTRMRLGKDKIKKPKNDVKTAKAKYNSLKKDITNLGEIQKKHEYKIKDMLGNINESYEKLKIYQNDLELWESRNQKLENVKNNQDELKEDIAKIDDLTEQLKTINTEISQLHQEINTINTKRDDLSCLSNNIPILRKLDTINRYRDAKPLIREFTFLTEKIKIFHSEIQKSTSKYNLDLHKPLEQSGNTTEIFEQSDSPQKIHHQLEIDPLIESLASHVEQFSLIAQDSPIRENSEKEGPVISSGLKRISSGLNKELSKLIKSSYDRQMSSTSYKKASKFQEIQITTHNQYIAAEKFTKQYISKTQKYRNEQENLIRQIESLKKVLPNNKSIADGFTYYGGARITKKRGEFLDNAIQLAESVINSHIIDHDIIQKKYNNFKEEIEKFHPSSEENYERSRKVNYERIEKFYAIIKQGIKHEIKQEYELIKQYKLGDSIISYKHQQQYDIWEEGNISNIVAKAIELEGNIYKHNILQIKCNNYYEGMYKYLQEIRSKLINNIEQGFKGIIQSTDNDQTKKSNLEEKIKELEENRSEISKFLKELRNNNINNRKDQLSSIDYNNTNIKLKDIKREIEVLQAQIKEDEKHRTKAIADLIEKDNLKADAENKLETAKSNYIKALKALAESQQRYLDTLNSYSSTIQEMTKDFSQKDRQHYDDNELAEHIKKEMRETEQQHQQTLNTYRFMETPS